MLARKISGHKDATEENHDLLSSTAARIMTVQQSTTELSYSMIRAMKLRQKRHSDTRHSDCKHCDGHGIAHIRRQQDKPTRSQSGPEGGGIATERK